MTSSAEQHINCDQVQCRRDAVTAEAITAGVPIAKIFNIQRYSLRDGQGIRTVVFFKGCPHTCPWCSNPESMSGRIHVVRSLSRCLHCPQCLNDPDECPSGAMQRIGYRISLPELIKQILKDEIFFRSSGGGVTLSGGEVLVQADFAAQLLQQLKQLGIATAIETAGDQPAEKLLRVAQYCDEVLFDFKIMNADQAKQVVNMNPQRVMDNFALLVQQGVRVTPRLPLIPGYTMDATNLEAILVFLRQHQITRLDLLPFHQYGESKYALLGKEYKMKDVAPPSEEEIAQIHAEIENRGFHVTIGG